MATESSEDLPDDSADTESANGGEVARDPDAIAREIEQTRAELADTIDAIADRVSPRRAASRGAAAVKSQVSAVFDRGSAEPPAAVLDASPEVAQAPQVTQAPPDAAAGTRSIASTGRGTQYTGTSEYGVARRLRTDRVLLVVGAVAGVTALVVLRRSRH